MMKSTILLLALAVVATNAFTTNQLSTSRSASLVTSYGYVPDGFTAESYKKFKEEEKKKQAAANLGKLGPRGFKSRSFQSFHEALERGEAAHLMPVFNAKEKVKKGELKVEDIPYMQRGGSWDDSDVRGAKKKKWLSSDKAYAGGGYKKEQSVSIFGYGEGLDWTGKKSRTGPAESIPGKPIKFAKNYKAPNFYELKGQKKPGNDAAPEKKKGFFGLF